MNVYLAGEIHSNWRDNIKQLCEKEGLKIQFSAPVTDHEASDMIGVWTLGEEENPFWRDRKGAGINAVRTRNAIKNADIVVVKFGEKYKQWNAAFDAGLASAWGKSLIILQLEAHDHALKEINAAADAVCRSDEQVVEILKYVLEKI
jgi:YtoQ family protein